MKIIALFLTLLYTSLVVNAQDKTQITVVREYEFIGGGVNYLLYHNDKPKALMGAGTYYTFTTEPGSFTLKIDNIEKSKVSGYLMGNDHKYFTVQVIPGFWTASILLTEVDSTFAQQLIKNRGIKELKEDDALPERKKKRFGLSLAAGFGFENIDVAQSYDGENSSISFGGGIGIGLQYGIEINPLLDLNLEANYAFSQLTPPLKNVDVTFSRINLSARPSLIFGSENHLRRFKLGAGIDYNLNPALDLDGTKIDYTSSLGFHIAGVYEMNFSNNWMYSMGLKFNNVQYDITEGSFSDNRLNNGNGMGLEFLFSFTKTF
jgi:hypothetical protein